MIINHHRAWLSISAYYDHLYNNQQARSQLISGAGRSPWSQPCSPISPSPTLRQGAGNPSKIQILVQKSFFSSTQSFLSTLPGFLEVAAWLWLQLDTGQLNVASPWILLIMMSTPLQAASLLPSSRCHNRPPSLCHSERHSVNKDSVAKILIFCPNADYSLRLVILWHLQLLSICSVNFLLLNSHGHQQVFFWGIALSLLSLQVNVSCHKTFNACFTMIYQTLIDCSNVLSLFFPSQHFLYNFFQICCQLCSCIWLTFTRSPSFSRVMTMYSAYLTKVVTITITTGSIIIVVTTNIEKIRLTLPAGTQFPVQRTSLLIAFSLLQTPTSYQGAPWIWKKMHNNEDKSRFSLILKRMQIDDNNVWWLQRLASSVGSRGNLLLPFPCSCLSCPHGGAE